MNTSRLTSRIIKCIVGTGIGLAIVGTIVAASIYLPTLNIEMLDPKGTIALKERNLMIFTVILGAVVIIPVFIMTAVIAWRYRETNTRAKAIYKPDWDMNHTAEAIWWGIPIILITILGIVTWQSTHHLDPYKPLTQHEKSLTVQVVALDWKWLFIYPEQGIATVNYVQFPTDTSINFHLTSDTVMSSFWIPQLSGQLYAMPGMTNKLHIDAHEPGDYRGWNANIAGEGFSDMRFTARASSQADFDAWVARVQQEPKVLSTAAYTKLYEKSIKHPVTLYGSVENNLYDTIVMKYMMPHGDTDTPEATPRQQTNDNTMDHSTMNHPASTQSTAHGHEGHM